jgi:ABC-type antimicrobial peptide transport system permease subunit
MPGMDGSDSTATVVGVVGDVRHRGPSQPPVPEAYFHYRQRPRRTWSMTLIVDSALGSTPTAALIRSEVRAVDSLVAPEIGSMEAAMAPFVEPSAFRAKLLAIVAAFTLALALVGIAGVVSHVAAKRRREMGIRAALGARPTSLTRLVIASGMRPVVAGALAGLFVALAAAQLLGALTFSISVRDPRALAVAAIAILVTGLVASWWPARRSSQVDPASVLRV